MNKVYGSTAQHSKKPVDLSFISDISRNFRARGLQTDFFIITKTMQNLSIYNFCLKKFSIKAIDGEVRALQIKKSGF